MPSLLADRPAYVSTVTPLSAVPGHDAIPDPLVYVPAPHYNSGLQIIRKDAWVPEDLQAKLKAFNPRSQMGAIVRECLGYLPAELAAELVERISSNVILESCLRVVTFHPREDGTIEVRDYGIVSEKAVTNTGVAYLVDAFQNVSAEPENFKFHGIGTGDGTALAEAASNTALATELTTQYSPDNTRATGSLTENAANVFRTVGTNTVDASVTIQEHGIFTVATSGSGTLLDRSLTGGNALTSGDSIQTTYDLTCTAGG